jgi:squalene synthase HpnC
MAAFDEAGAIMARARGENFPVALRALPARHRRHLLAIYGFARLVDEIGDSAPGDRLERLDELESELDRAFAGHAAHPLLRALQPTLSECALPRGPFLRLIEANRTDQRVVRYETWEELLGYCELSANPVGELVLEVFDLATPARVALSDAVCTGLQLVEHWQDVGEDAAGGRVYLPLSDLERFGCSTADLRAPRVSASLRRLLAHEAARTAALLDRGRELVASLRGWPRIAIACYAGGGRAALDALARADYEVLGASPRPTRRRELGSILRMLGAAS